MESFLFGDRLTMADELLALVLVGKKTATTWAAADGTKGVEVGKRWTVLDGAGSARAVIETTELAKYLFNEVPEAIAFDEGEGDRSLLYWRQAHTEYFTRLGQFAPDREVYCERFWLASVMAAQTSRDSAH